MASSNRGAGWYAAAVVSVAVHVAIAVSVRAPRDERTELPEEAVRVTLTRAAPPPAPAEPVVPPEPIREPEPVPEPEPAPVPEPAALRDTVPREVERSSTAPREDATERDASPTGVLEEPTERELDAYRHAVRRRIEAAREYPLTARRREEEGTVVVRFTLNQRGALAGEPAIQERTRSARLNAAALEAVTGGAPYPPFDGDGWPDRITFVVPIRFILD